MGIYINIGNDGFQRARNGKYVDKSGLIAIVNATLHTELCMSCVTRCRRFGKSMAAKMLCAYYDHSCDSRHLFADLKIANDPTFEKHLNKFDQIHRKEYIGKVAQYGGQVILVGINYDRQSKKHSCIIEKYNA